MRKIKLTKIELKEIEVLQDEVNVFILNKSALILAYKNTDQFFNELLLLAIAQRIYYSFRRIIENATNSIIASITCDAEEAIILMQVCVDSTKKGQYEVYALDRIKNLLHQQLTNLIQPL